MSPSGPSTGFDAMTSFASALKPHSVGPRLYPWSSIGPLSSRQFSKNPELPAMIVLLMGVGIVSLLYPPPVFDVMVTLFSPDP